MNEPDSPKRFAWEPLTPPGVAAFAGASLLRLWLVQLIFALLAATALVWFLKTAWFPTIDAAVQQLPPHGEICDGKLIWPAASPQVLAEGNFLAFTVDLAHEGQVRSPAHLQAEFGRTDFFLISFLGYEQIPYPPEAVIAFNRAELEPKWGAWRPPILWLTFTGAVAGLLSSWTALATIYFPVVWLVGFFANRKLDCRACWKLAGAGLMPGAMLLTAAIFSYGLGALDLLQLTAAFIAHFVLGWAYLIVAPLFVPKLEAAVSTNNNPFAKPADAPPGASPERPGDDASPFKQ